LSNQIVLNDEEVDKENILYQNEVTHLKWMQCEIWRFMWRYFGQTNWLVLCIHKSLTNIQLQSLNWW